MKQKYVKLEKILVTRKFAESYEEAMALVSSGHVLVNGIAILKADSQVSSDAGIKIAAAEKEWVSRGAYKLLKALDSFSIDPSGRECADIGASTGGFTDVLLSRGAARVWSVDVGYGQLAWKLRNDPRVTVLDRTNARYLTPDSLGSHKCDIVVSDASFISLRLLLAPLSGILTDTGVMAVLLKPQFEVRREDAPGGVVSDPEVHAKVIDDTSSFIENDTDLRLLGITYSPIRGPEGNIEFLFKLGHKSSYSAPSGLPDTRALTAEAGRMAEHAEHR